MVAFAIVLAVLCLGFLFTTAFMDPGFIPRDQPDDMELGYVAFNFLSASQRGHPPYCALKAGHWLAACARKSVFKTLI